MVFDIHSSGLLFVEEEELSQQMRCAQKPIPTLSFAETQFSVFVTALEQSTSPAKSLDFRSYFALVLLTQPFSRSPPIRLAKMDVFKSGHPLATWTSNTQYFMSRIRDVFEGHLLFRNLEHDQWHKGQEIFDTHVKYFLEKRQRVRFCLPAFPCKSSNPEKVGSIWPDGAEYEALTNLYSFSHTVRQVYPLGCCVDVVSDELVFSDCVGVDDETVTRYTQRLQTMAMTVQKNFTQCVHRDCSQLNTFKGLHEILSPMPWTKHFFMPEHARAADVIHPVNTERADRDDVNRGILLRSCSACHSSLEKILRNVPSSSLTMLYRGFSRFMLDDLQAHPDGRGKSKSQRKKIGEKVAMEMMRRNQAYSHLVELVLPRHVRLSIHAHNNAGPKFAISLLPKDKFRPLTSFDGLRLSTQHEQYDERHHLHIGTPWHNALVCGEGDDTTYICKAGLVKAELEREGSVWSDDSGYVAHHKRGGRYVLYKVKSPFGTVVELKQPDVDEVAVA